jgi:hypothetical protein
MEKTDVSEVVTVSIIRGMMEAVLTSVMSVSSYPRRSPSYLPL